MLWNKLYIYYRGYDTYTWRLHEITIGNEKMDESGLYFLHMVFNYTPNWWNDEGGVRVIVIFALDIHMWITLSGQILLDPKDYLFYLMHI